MAAIAYQNIHRRQLFHWVGRHIEIRAASGDFTDPLRKEYVDCLRNALKNGLWVKTPHDPDRLGDDSKDAHFQVNRPITCFTEWLVGESLPHTTRYGRLGLGFPRNFVFKRGGHPVVYVKGLRLGDQYTKNLLNLRELLEDERLPGILGAKELADHKARLDYITHFAKWSRKPSAAKPRSRDSTRQIAKAGLIKAAERNFKRKFGQRQDLLEEREWRIVYHSSFRKYFVRNAERAAGPAYYIPFEPGEELFTVVLPDNRTVNMVMNDRSFVRQLYRADAPHVTVLSLEDIGTF
ncbi:MAG: abortive infection system antitoxin AbiGi family protein [Chthoniobacter sp.]|nr:abortive infection system antitoxin AbiGi family protein [Chthoniobacter sp.]